MHPGWYIFLIILLFLMIIFSGIMIFSNKSNMIISQVFINSRKNTNSLILIPLIIIFAISIILAVLAGVLIKNKSKFLNIFFIFFNILLLGSVIFFSIEVSKPSFTFVNIDEYVIYGLIALGSICVLFGIILTIEFMLSKKIEKNDLYVEPLSLGKEKNLSPSERKKCDYIIKRLEKENTIYLNRPHNDFIIDNDNDTHETIKLKSFVKALKWKINGYFPGCQVNLGVLNSLFYNKFNKNKEQTENFIDKIIKDYNKY